MINDDKSSLMKTLNSLCLPIRKGCMMPIMILSRVADRELLVVSAVLAAALICDADGSAQEGNKRAPHGPDFFSPAWRELYIPAWREADRLGLEMSLNIQSGWNLGGPMVKPEDAPKKLVWTETLVTGGTNLSAKLAQAEGRDGFYRDLFVLAVPLRVNAPEHKSLKYLDTDSWEVEVANWTPPFRVNISSALKPGANLLEVDVVNFWPNRVIGDASMPPEQRRTQTNTRKFGATTPLLPSGLLGPVTVLSQ